MKEKLDELKKSIKALIAETDKLISEGKLDEAKAKQTEIKSAQSKAEIMKEQLAIAESEAKAEEKDKVATLETENKALKAEAQKPVRPVFANEDDTPEEDTVSDGIKAFSQLKYGELEPAIKAVIADLYGTKYSYNEKRLEQMKAFVKYIRFGESRLSAKEHELLVPGSKNIILRPDMIKAEILSGRTVAEMKATLEEGSNDLGGYLVPEDYRTEITKRLMGLTVVRGKARVITTTRDTVEWPRLEGGNNIYTSAVRVTWVDETPTSATIAQTNPTFGFIKIPIHTVMARTDLSRNLLEDSAFNLLEIMSGLFAEAMAVDEDNQFLVGAGAGTPYGVLGDLANGAQQSPVAGVTDVNSGSASQIVADGFVDLVYSLPAQYRQNAVHVMARTTLRDARKLKDGDGRYIWQAGLVAGQPSTILGYQVFENENMPAIAALNYVDIFGDWLNGYVIADRVGMSVERVTDTTTTGNNTIALFARRRLGGQTVAPWAFAALQISV